MKRFEPNYDGRLIIDNVTGKEYPVHSGAEEPIIDLLNQLSDRGDMIIEAYSTPELLKLRLQKEVYKNFSDATMNILNKHEIESLAKLDQILFNQVKW